MKKSFTVTSAAVSTASTLALISEAKEELASLEVERAYVRQEDGWFATSFLTPETEEGMQAAAEALGEGMYNGHPCEWGPLPACLGWHHEKKESGWYVDRFDAPVLLFSPQSWGIRETGGGFERLWVDNFFDPDWDEWSWDCFLLRPWESEAFFGAPIPAGAWARMASASSGSEATLRKVSADAWKVELRLPPSEADASVPYEGAYAANFWAGAELAEKAWGAANLSDAEGKVSAEPLTWSLADLVAKATA